MVIKGVTLALLAGVSWGVLGLYGIKLHEMGLTSNEIAFSRMLFASIAGFIYILYNKERKKHLKIKKASIGQIILIGLVTQALLNFFFYASILKVGSITATMLLCSGPFFTLILSKFFLKEPLTLEKQCALSIASIGAILLITEGNLNNIILNGVGIFYGLLSGLCYGLYPIIGKKSSGGGHPVVNTVFGFLVASICFIPFINVSELFSKFSDFKILLSVISFGLIPTLLAYILFLESMKYIPASIASILTLFEIPCTAIIGYFLLGESFNSYKFLGLLLVLIGISITNLKFSSLKKSK